VNVNIDILFIGYMMTYVCGPMKVPGLSVYLQPAKKSLSNTWGPKRDPFPIPGAQKGKRDPFSIPGAQK